MVIQSVEDFWALKCASYWIEISLMTTHHTLQSERAIWYLLGVHSLGHYLLHSLGLCHLLDYESMEYLEHQNYDVVQKCSHYWIWDKSPIEFCLGFQTEMRSFRWYCLGVVRRFASPALLSYVLYFLRWHHNEDGRLHVFSSKYYHVGPTKLKPDEFSSFQVL